MKKLTGWLLILMIGFTACEGPMGPEGPQGRDGKNGRDGESTQWFVNDYDVFERDWTIINEGYVGAFFEYKINIPELTGFVFDEGAVICYLVEEVSYDGGKKSLIQSPLPYTIYGEYYDDGFPYSENYSYEVGPGYIRFIVKYSDFSNDIPPTRTFHVVLMW